MFLFDSNLIVVTPDLLKRMAWGTHFQGPLRRIVRQDLYLHGQRKCKGELLECGHILVPNDGSRHMHRRCPLCNSHRALNAHSELPLATRGAHCMSCVGRTSALPWRRIQYGLLDSQAVPRHSLAGTSVAFLTWPTMANLFWTA